MTLYSFEGHAPDLPDDGDFWIAPDANVIGRVVLGSGVSIWFGATLRGDNDPITIGAGTNVQEAVVMHTDPGMPLRIGRDCTIGHKAMVHGCTIGDETMIGMGATVLNGARVGRNCLIGAGALIPEGKEIPDGSLVMGMPGKVVKTLDDTRIDALRRSAEWYRVKMRRFRDGLAVVGTGA